MLRMAADQERADRIKALKRDRPDLTWRRIADYVGVTERSAADWQRKGGIGYDNAKKLAEIFEVDVDWIMRGERDTGTPSPFAGSDDLADRLDRIDARLELLDARFERIETLLRGDEDEEYALPGVRELIEALQATRDEAPPRSARKATPEAASPRPRPRRAKAR